MGITPFPHGISSMGVPILGTPTIISGDVYWVGATAGASWVAGVNAPECGQKATPFATIDYAIGKCTANNGDVIYVLPGHTETVAAAAGIACDVAGISIIGVGQGSLKPQITLSATTSTIAVSAANITIKNVGIVPGIAEIVTVFDITAAYCTLDGITCKTNSTYCIMTMVLTTTAADYLTIQNCDWLQTVKPAANSKFITLAGVDRCKIINNAFDIQLTDHASSTVIGGSAASTNVLVQGNVIRMPGGTTQLSGILLYAATTGICCDNRVFTAATALAGAINPANCYCAENYAENAVAKNGVLDPTVTSDLRLKTMVVYL